MQSIKVLLTHPLLLVTAYIDQLTINPTPHPLDPLEIHQHVRVLLELENAPQFDSTDLVIQKPGS